jgi:hypothetical protein
MNGVEPLLEGRNAVRVNQFDSPAPFRYLRLREPPYDDAALAAWAQRLRPLLDDEAGNPAKVTVSRLRWGRS